MWSYNYSAELQHHGVLGMKWGHRKPSKITLKIAGAASNYNSRQNANARHRVKEYGVGKAVGVDVVRGVGRSVGLAGASLLTAFGSSALIAKGHYTAGIALGTVGGVAITSLTTANTVHTGANVVRDIVAGQLAGSKRSSG